MKKHKQMKYTREELISICEASVVSFHDWHDRDSYSAQINVSSIYSLLSNGCDFKISNNIDDHTIWIEFKNITEEIKHNYSAYSLPIDSLEDYREEFGYDNEMFEGYGIDINSNYLGGYLPTRKRLLEANGGDWY